MADLNPNKILFQGKTFPPTAMILDADWRKQIASHSDISHLFDEAVIAIVREGGPVPVDDIFPLLSFWVSKRNDHVAVRHVYALRLQLDAYLFNYSLSKPSADLYAWNLLGISCVGRKVAIRVDHTLHLNVSVQWQLYTLWSWNRVKCTDLWVCTLGVAGPAFRVVFRLQDLQINLLLFLFVGAYLWPPAFPVRDLDLVMTLCHQGQDLTTALEAFQSA